MKEWAWNHFRDLIEKVLRDLRSLRVLWSWIYLALYVWVIVWGVLFYPQLCLNTAITATATLAMAALTNYVWSRSSEKKVEFSSTSTSKIVKS